MCAKHTTVRRSGPPKAKLTACSGHLMMPMRLPSGPSPRCARPGTINPADAVDLQAVGYTRLRALVQVREDSALHHVAGRIEADRVDVLRGAGIRHIHRVLASVQLALRRFARA